MTTEKKNTSTQPLGLPEAQGLYDPANEHDSCGVGFLCHLKGKKSHRIVKGALEMNVNMEHRGGCGCDEATGDGAGLFIQLPHKFFKTITTELDFDLPEEGQYAVGFVHLSPDQEECANAMATYEKMIKKEGQTLLGWRDVPTNSEILGKAARECEPQMKQVFIARNPEITDDQDFERKLYVLRRRTAQAIRYCTTSGAEYFYTVTLSARTIVYKGMLTTWQLKDYFPDLQHEDVESAMALVHSRFSTNTFPSWPRAQPFRYMSHNGEINTMRGNANWMQARQKLLGSGVLGEDLDKLLPIIREDGSDSAMFDNCLEFLVLSGRTLPEAIMMMIPEPWENHQHMTDTKKAFYEYNATLMEPWDGPASIAFCDGISIGAILDRNGLRPSRYYVTNDDLVIMASEVGVLEVDPATVVKKGRLEPGRMFLVDTQKGRIVDNAEVKEEIASKKPYAEWLEKNRVFFAELAAGETAATITGHDLIQRNRAFGYTFEDKRFILGPSAETGNQPLGAMGNDTPMAVLSDRPQLLYNYFRQLFAQVTNPAIDPIREELITSSITFVGSEKDILNPGPDNCRMVRLESPIIDNQQLARLRDIDLDGFSAETLPIIYRPEKVDAGLAVGQLPGHVDNPHVSDDAEQLGEVSGEALKTALDQLFKAADTAILHGDNVLILSDRGMNKKKAAIPALLAVAGLHHHLIRNGTRTKVSIVLESGEPREVHHFAVLLGYGVDVVNPYLAIDTLAQMTEEGELDMDHDTAVQKYLKASIKGVIKTMSKMGISTVASYRGAQIFECIGLNEEVIDQYFTRTTSRVKGIGLETISREVKLRHDDAYKPRETENEALDAGGVYQWRFDGERHLFGPQAIHLLQQSTRLGDFEVFRQYSKLIDDQAKGLCTLRGLMDFKFDPAKEIPIDEVEPVSAIVKRFKTGAMSYGSISEEAHEALAVAMNRLGGKSNTGEGGEDPYRFRWTNDQGDSKKSAIKQVASGRFGVTSHYLVNSREIQIKIAQGAKPGEGGELPGHKVLPQIAKVRGTTPGVGLISPPPHHDIYSIEDMAELIHDLKNANTDARINVKLVSEVGVGTIAAGVAKAKADVILIAGHDGGTGASPRSSIQHAGSPWELGLAETNQTLLLNDLRSRVVLETDGQLKTGRDVVIGALLGAEEFGFATAPLVTLGCIMMRVCHKNTCPVGIATQNTDLRKKFNGAVENVVNYMNFVAQEIRELMAKLGFRSITEMVGRSDKLEMRKAVDHWKAQGLDYSKILYRPKVGPEVGTYAQQQQDHLLDRALDNTTILELCRPAIESYEKVHAELPITNINRVVGTITGAEISRHHGAAGLPEDTIHLKFNGSAGQSLGAFCPKGMTFELEGDANDYIGKGVCGAKIIVYPPKNSLPEFVADENIIVGNVAFYGATNGEAYMAGIAGERFCVRNSGVHAVIEGVGDHACEYMTGGSVTILGSTGRNFGAGMSGGVGYIYNEHGDFESKNNDAMTNLYPLIECEDSEIEEVKARIQKHVDYTGSVKGQRILDNWESESAKFLKVMPADYERVLNALKRAEESGLEGDAAILAAFEENAKVGN
ncbi:glutamate synthase large subunit [Verrucomicrobiaceae bacterium N1E253]|uniref:Glutamate synthase [NADPH] large chain n=1 Tax=Oceaniferula marina TaxID=2748318 RepID=A0A851GAN9_9BACT|nr:glutamate synthase large subunit [Oceaniferula marina]NWK54683.1 glutamate synthase large subunit [Oceaniferula marina]